ncbi:MAG TPA: GNAT family N-acetyltransferase [Nocardioides sp.]
MSAPTDDLTVERLDPASPRFAEDAFAWHGVYEAACRYGRGRRANLWAFEELRAVIVTGRTDVDRAGYVARRDGTVVGGGLFSLPLLDNLTVARFNVWVPADLRRRGIGRAVHDAMLADAVARGRTVLQGHAHEGPGEHGEDVGGPAFAEALGYEVALVELQSRVDLPIEAARLDALATAAAPRHAPYELRSWEGPVPEEIVASYVALDAVVDVEAPSGDLDLEPLTPDVEVWRQKEGESAAQGRRNVSTAALTADGEVVALTELWSSAHEPERLDQWSTIVRRDHRGRRLGVAIKVANHRFAHDRFPAATEVVTWNAESNEHMLAVNGELGFRVVERTRSLQRRLG